MAATLATHSRTSGRRSPHWRAVERAHLRRQPGCQVCGGRKRVEVHHMLPYHLEPGLELEPSNLLTLCRPHHLTFGHLERWQSFNGRVREDCALWRKKILSRP